MPRAAPALRPPFSKDIAVKHHLRAKTKTL